MPLATIAEHCDRELLRIKPRADATNVDPVLHCSLDIAHDNANLAEISEQSAHDFLLTFIDQSRHQDTPLGPGAILWEPGGVAVSMTIPEATLAEFTE
jgi:hypothetical protein